MSWQRNSMCQQRPASLLHLKLRCECVIVFALSGLYEINLHGNDFKKVAGEALIASMTGEQLCWRERASDSRWVQVTAQFRATASLALGLTVKSCRNGAKATARTDGANGARCKQQKEAGTA